MDELSPVAPANDTPVPETLLARLRRERGLTAADVAVRLKYSVRQIEALEAEQFDRLPGPTFVRGMIRAYARLLEADPGPVLRAFENRPVASAPTRPAKRAKPVPFSDSAHRHNRLYLALSLVALAAVAAVLYEEWYAERRVARPLPAAPVAVAPKAAPAAAQVASAALAPTGAASSATAAPSSVSAPDPAAKTAGADELATVVLRFDGESWVGIEDADGHRLMWQLNPAGSVRSVRGKPPLSLVIGNAAAVELTYNGAIVDLKPYIKVEVARLTLD